MSWKDHFHPLQNPPVSSELWQTVMNWIEETYGVGDSVVLRPIKVTDDFWEFACGLEPHGNIWVELKVHSNGTIEDTLVIYTRGNSPQKKRITMPPGQLPSDNATAADLAATESYSTWKERPVGWNALHQSIFRYLTQIAQRNDIPFDCITVTGIHPDGEECHGGTRSFSPTMAGLRDALTHLRALIKSGTEWQRVFKGQQTAGSFCMMMFPGYVPPDDGEMLVLSPDSGYRTLKSSSPGAEHCSWVDVLPMG